MFLDVAHAFHLLRQQREDLGALEITRVTLLERLTELEERERLGRSRLSEVASAEAQLARVEATIELIRRQERTARHLLEFLTGVEPIDGIADSSPSFLMPPDESTYLDMAGSRADVRAAYEAWQKSRMEVVIARSKVWPTIDLEGTYYTKRIGASSGVDWDATISVSLPLFQGGEAVGGIQTASSHARQKELEFLRLKRQARLEIRDAWAEFDSAWNRSAALEKASNASERSFLLQTEEYRRNLVNNLDVLQALQALQDTRREWITAEQETKRLYWQLRVTTGDIP
ncbi:MAG: TolC family protein [Candidatus Omnitrophica bacterium]|nr:TolC family protein [Candidatus Omnitrophota bacterium]